MNINAKWRELKTPYMLKMLKSGIRKIKRNRITCSDGNMINLISKYSKTGWKYQVEYVHDERFRPNPYIAVYAFNPKICGCERADYYLIKEL